MRNYSKLYGKIVEVCGTQRQLAQEIGLSEHSLSRKLNQEIDFKQSEIDKLMATLGIEGSEIGEYFFTQQVQRN